MIDKDDDIAEAEQRQAEDYAEAYADEIAEAKQRQAEDYAEAEADDIAGAEQREVEASPLASRALLKFCRSLFETGNLIETDFEDVSVMKVERPFVQDEAGLHVQFTVSWHAIGKTGKGAHDALEVLLPEKPDPTPERE